MIQISGSSDRAIVDLQQGDYEELLGLEAQRCEQGPEEALPPVPERMGLIRGRALLSTPMSKNTWTATSAALAAVWARRATDPGHPRRHPQPERLSAIHDEDAAARCPPLGYLGHPWYPFSPAGSTPY
jgi:hypothetical protein